MSTVPHAVPAEVLAGWPRAGAHRLRIMHFLPLLRLELGGPIRAVIDLSEALAERGHLVDVAACDDSDCPANWRSTGERNGMPRLHRYEVGKLPGPLFTPRQLADFARRLPSYDVIHFHNIWRPAILQLAPAAERAGVPYIISTRGMLDDWPMGQKTLKKRLYLALGGRSVLERAGWVHCTALREREQTEKWIGGGRTAIVPNFMDISAYRERPDPAAARAAFDVPDDGVPLVLFLSRVVHNKGPDILIRAAADLARRGRNFRVIIAGGGEPAYVARMRALAAAQGLRSTVKFVGMVSGELKLSLLAAATVMAVPTCQENFGFVFFEALASGTPVLATRRVDLASELEAGGGTVLSDLDDRSVAEALDRFVSNPEWARATGTAGRKWAFEFLDREPLIDRYETLYETAHERGAVPFEPAPYFLAG